ncbi:hypothetical protein V8C35DRAFT_297089 [Trichoderma chlorosporum]
MRHMHAGKEGRWEMGGHFIYTRDGSIETRGFSLFFFLFLLRLLASFHCATLFARMHACLVSTWLFFCFLSLSSCFSLAYHNKPVAQVSHFVVNS